MQDYVNVHGLLEQRRAAAKEAGTREGPRILVHSPFLTSPGLSHILKWCS